MLLSAMLPLAVGCLGYKSDYQNNSATNPDARTGFTEPKKQPSKAANEIGQAIYTVSGHSEVIAKIKAKYGMNEGGTLAQEILGVEVDLTQLQASTYDSPVSKAKMRIQLQGAVGPLQFFAPSLEKVSTSAKGALSLEESGQPYELFTECHNSECTLLSLHLSRYSKNSSGHKISTQDFASIFYSVESQRVAIQSNINFVDLKSPLREIWQTLDSGSLLKSTWVVIGGRSQTNLLGSITLVGRGNVSLQARIQLLETDLSPSSALVRLGETDFQAELQGNNPATGALAFDIWQSGENLESQIRLRLFVGSEFSALRALVAPTPVLEPSDAPINPDLKEGLFVLVGATENSKRQETHQRLNSYLRSRWVKDYIQIWTGRSQRGLCGEKNQGFPARLTQFYRNMRPFEKNLDQLFTSLDVNPEISHLMLLESNFGIKSGYPIEVTSDPLSTASGPFQITNTLGRHLKEGLGYPSFALFPLQGGANGGRKLDPRDDRNFLGPSAKAAGIYMRHLFELFPKDPGLAVLSYILGQGATAQRMKCSNSANSQERERCLENSSATDSLRNRHRNFSVTLEQLRELNMVGCEFLDYTYSYLALRGIGINPKSFQFEPPPGKSMSANEIQKIWGAHFTY